MTTTERATAEINRTAFRQVAAAIEADPGKYNQKRCWDPERKYVDLSGCGTACCVLGHAAQIAGRAQGREELEIAEHQIGIAMVSLRIEGPRGTALVSAAWPVAWFLKSGACELKDLRRGSRYLVWKDERIGGTLVRAEPKAAEAVTILNWIADLGHMPEA